MKRVLRVMSYVFGVIIILFSAVGCNKMGEVTAATVLLREDNLVVIRVDDFTGDASLYDALVFLKAKGKLDFESETSMYGPSLLSLNGKANPSDWSYFWSSYVCDKRFGNPDNVFTYDGNTYYYANYGMDQVYLQKGGIYLWTFEKSPW